MKELVEFAGAPEAIWNSLILTGLTLRTFRTAVSTRFAPFASAHSAVPTTSPFHADFPEVTVKITLLVMPGAISPTAFCEPWATAVQPVGRSRPSSTPAGTGALV